MENNFNLIKFLTSKVCIYKVIFCTIAYLFVTIDSSFAQNKTLSQFKGIIQSLKITFFKLLPG